MPVDLTRHDRFTTTDATLFVLTGLYDVTVDLVALKLRDLDGDSDVVEYHRLIGLMHNSGKSLLPFITFLVSELAEVLHALTSEALVPRAEMIDRLRQDARGIVNHSAEVMRAGLHTQGHLL
jgi:hypothetical protein